MNLIKNALSNLKGHKLRVFVTIVWIIIGITSVIVVSSIGNGLEEEVKNSVNKVNPNKTKIRFEPMDYNMTNMSVFLQPFTNKDIEELSFTEGVERIGPSKDDFDMGSTYFTDGYVDKKMTGIEISPCKNIEEIKPMIGRSFSLDDTNRKVIMITMQNATDLFKNPEDALGNGISISGNIYEVIGVLDQTSLSGKTKEDIEKYYGSEYITSYMPKKSFDTLMSQYNYPSEIHSLDLLVSKGYDVFEVANNVISKLYELHPDINGSYNTEDPSLQAEELKSMTSQINKFVTIITIIAMFVGGIGVMNIMYVSVMERQREIGIRRAIGAKPRTIMFQFLVEAVFITVCGGILGIIVGFIVTNYASGYLPYKPIPSFNSFIYAVITTILTGVVFGIIPAYKASKLDPIKAIYK